MSILSVDSISPIGSGTTITLNAAKTVVGTGITFESNGQAIYAGIITATSFSGSGANLTSLPAQATIANNADNRVITGGSGVNLNGEANLTYDGTTLKIGGDSGVTGTWGLEVYNTDTSNNLGKAVFAGNQGAEIKLQDTVSGETVRIAANGQASFYSEKAGDPMVFFTKPSGGSNTERLRIASNGLITVNRDGVGGRIDATAGDSSIKISDGNGRSSIKVSDPGSGNSYEWELTSAGNFKAPNGKGIDFSATANAGSPSSASSELFDDYEEGSWTPGLSGSSSVTGQTYSSRSGYYTKIGNRVFCDFSIIIGTKGSYGGTYIQIVNLPFTINSAAYTRSCSTPIYFRTLNYRWCFLGLQQHEGQAKAYIFGVEGPGSGTDGASNRSYPNGGDIANGTEMTCSFSYLAA